MDGNTSEVLLDHAKDVAVTLDEDEVIQYVNPRTEEVLDYRPEDVVDRKILDLVHPDDRADIGRVFAENDASTMTSPVDVENRAITPYGETVWVETRIAPSDSTADVEWVVWMKDIHERKERILELQEELVRHRELFESSNDALWMFDADWSELLYINDAYEDIWNHSIEELEDDPASFLNQIYPDHREQVLRSMERLSEGIPDELIYRVNERKNYGVWIWVQAAPILEDGEVVRIAGLARDVTELQNRNLQANVIDRVLRHQIRNRLTVILGYTQGLSDQVETDVVDKIVENCYTLLDLQSKFGEILGILAEKAPRCEFDLVELARESAQSVRADDSDAELELDLPPEASVEAISRLPKAVNELFANAAEHAPPSGAEIAVRIECDSNQIRLVVADENPPVPDTEVQIMNGETDVDALNHGTGLGLWLVKWIIDRSDGTFDYRRNEPRGNVFEIGLPRSRPLDGVP